MTPVATFPRRSAGAKHPTVVKHRKLLRQSREEEIASVAELVTAIESDYQFRLAYLVLTSLIQAAPAVVTAHGEEKLGKEDLARAEILAQNLTSIWKESLPQALRAIAYGRAAFERTYRHEPVPNLYLVDGLDYLPFENTKLILDGEGSFAGIELTVEEESIHLEPARSWWFALDPTTRQPHGKSRYLGAPLEIYKKRKQLEEQEGIWFSKFALGHGIARAPEKEDLDPAYDVGDLGDVNATGEISDPMEVMREQCTLIESGGVLVLSSKAYDDGKFLYDYTPTEGQRDGAPLENRRRMLDAAALRSLGIPERALTQEGETGSHALADVHRQVLEQTCEGIVGPLANGFEKHVIAKAIAVNSWSQLPPVLRLVRQPVGSEHRRFAQDIARSLVKSTKQSPWIGDGGLDVQKVFELADLPLSRLSASP